MDGELPAVVHNAAQALLHLMRCGSLAGGVMRAGTSALLVTFATLALASFARFPGALSLGPRKFSSGVSFLLGSRDTPPALPVSLREIRTPLTLLLCHFESPFS